MHQVPELIKYKSDMIEAGKEGKEDHFVLPGSIVRTIWSKSDTVLFLFAGAAAEFALNKEVDWLYYTGKLPADPLGRLLSTVSYARNIVFATQEQAFKTIDHIVHIHAHVEKGRGKAIPMEAYRDVLFMLIYYSVAAFECLERPLSGREKEEVYAVFYTMGLRMGLTDLPETYPLWLPVREQHLQDHLRYSACTKDLFLQYKKHLGGFRYSLMKMVQSRIVPATVRQMLHLEESAWIKQLLFLYKSSRICGLDRLAKEALLPAAYKKQLLDIDNLQQ